VALVLLSIFIGGLWFISHIKTAATVQETVHKKKEGFNLPPKPNEYWTYIDKLENRQSGSQPTLAPNSPEQAASHPPLTPEQKQLLEQMSDDMRNQPIQLNEVPWNQQNTAQNKIQNTPASAPKAQTADTNEQNKPAAKTAGNTKPSLTPNTQAKITANQIATGKKLLVQCGAFKAVEQAESIKAQLAFEGFESRVTTSNGWHKVVIGPFENQTKRAAAIKRLHHANHSNCIAISLKG
jgi:cell division protein FtsN